MALFQTFIRYWNVFAASCSSAGGFGKPLNVRRPKHLLLPFDVLLQIGSEGFVIKKGYALGKIFVRFNFLKMMGLAKFRMLCCFQQFNQCGSLHRMGLLLELFDLT